MTYIRPAVFYYFWLAFATIACAFITSCESTGEVGDAAVSEAQKNLFAPSPILQKTIFTP